MILSFSISQAKIMWLLDTLSRCLVALDDGKVGWLKSCHNDVVGHLGVTATCKKLQDAGHSWRGMRVDVVILVHSVRSLV
jgi:hypothetical protein